MKNSRIILIGLTFVFLASATQAQEASPSPKPRGPSVALSLIVTDKTKKSIATVDKDQIRVIEDEVVQVVESVGPDNRPADYGLVIDASGSTRSMLSDILEAAKLIVSNRRPADQIFVERFISSDKIQMLEDFTADNTALVASLHKIKSEGGQSAVIDALYVAAQRVAAHNKNNQERRKALVIITDGEDRNSSYKLNSLTKLLREQEIQVFVIGFVRDLADSNDRVGRESPRERAEKLLNTIAEESGGRVFFPATENEVREAAALISLDLQSQFRILYRSHDSKRTGFRKVEVKLNSPTGRKVIVPPGYYVETIE